MRGNERAAGLAGVAGAVRVAPVREAQGAVAARQDRAPTAVSGAFVLVSLGLNYKTPQTDWRKRRHVLSGSLRSRYGKGHLLPDAVTEGDTSPWRSPAILGAPGLLEASPHAVCIFTRCSPRGRLRLRVQKGHSHIGPRPVLMASSYNLIIRKDLSSH